MTMVERVAKIVRDDPNWPWRGLPVNDSPTGIAMSEAIVRTVLRAAREPSEAMENAALPGPSSPGWEICRRSLIIA